MSALLACVEHAAAPSTDSGLIAFTVGFGALAFATYGAGLVAFVRLVQEQAAREAAEA